MIKTENDIWRILTPIIQAAVARFDGVRIARAWQPTPQAVGAGPRLLLHRVGSRRVGTQGKSRQMVLEDGKLVELETWIVEDTFQANALVDRAPNDDGFTAGDLLTGLVAHLQSQPALDALALEGLGILRINEITEIPYEDETNAWRFSVSVKFVLTYPQTLERVTPIVTSVTHEMHRV